MLPPVNFAGRRFACYAAYSAWMGAEGRRRWCATFLVATRLPQLKGLWRNGSASDSRSEGWEFESLWPHFAVSAVLLANYVLLRPPCWPCHCHPLLLSGGLALVPSPSSVSACSSSSSGDARGRESHPCLFAAPCSHSPSSALPLGGACPCCWLRHGKTPLASWSFRS